MVIYRFRYCVPIAGEKSRFYFYCSADNEAEAVQKLGAWMQANPGDYRSIAGAFKVSIDDVPCCIPFHHLESGAAVRVG